MKRMNPYLIVVFIIVCFAGAVHNAQYWIGYTYILCLIGGYSLGELARRVSKAEL